MSDFLWWKDGVIYQIYPRSFADSNADGLGDLFGIISHLDYLVDLGIDAIWLSPIYPSPDVDFGYDVSDYCSVDSRFGSLADFDRLVAEAHRRGIRVILDMVMNHTSDQHEWFKQSRSSRNNAKRDWYIWQDHPNNWQASFGGKAWDYDAVTGQYYLHLFAKEQPDLNWRNPEVRKAQLEAFRFWLERGVDGFRLDVFNAYFKHPDFPDNPPKFGLRGFDRQKHIYDIDQPDMISLLNELRNLLDSYHDRYAVGEPYLAELEKIITYCGPDKLLAAFNFDFIPVTSDLAMALKIYPLNPTWILQKIRAREQSFSAAGIWPTNVMSNHDLSRAASRYTRGENDSRARIAMALLLTLRGTPFIYYGEEIGMRDIQLRRNEILDPPGKKYWPFYKGRDVCRSPMQWNNELYAGFSSTSSWLPVNPDYLHRNVTAQQKDPNSLFNFTKNLLGLRRNSLALTRGDFIPLKSRRGVLAYLRNTEEQTALVAINFTPRPADYPLPSGKWQILLAGNPDLEEASASLSPYEVRILTDIK